MAVMTPLLPHRSHWQLKLTAATSPGQGGGCTSSWGRTATLPASSPPTWAMTSQRSSTPSMRSSSPSLVSALTSACPASTMSWARPPQRGSWRRPRSCRAHHSLNMGWTGPWNPLHSLRHHHHLLHALGPPGLRATCWVRTPPVLSWKILLSYQGHLWTMWAKGSIWSEGAPCTGMRHPTWHPCVSTHQWQQVIPQPLALACHRGKEKCRWLPWGPQGQRYSSLKAEQKIVAAWHYQFPPGGFPLPAQDALLSCYGG